MTTFSEMINKTRSRKISLVHMRSSKRLRFFTFLGVNTYSKVLDFFADSFSVNGVIYSRVDVVTTANTFKYDISTKTLSFKTNGTNPEMTYSVITFRHFFSNIPLILPWDLSTGLEVEYEARIKDLGSTKLELDTENKGIAVESDSSITLESNDSFFAEIFDLHIWENKDIEFYSWFENIAMSERKLIYKGVVQDKSFDPKQVKFSIKDKFVSLRDSLKLNLFDIGDGNYDDSLYLKPKRRIYGEVSKLLVTGIDKSKGLIYGDGLITASSGSSLVSGSGTFFMRDLSNGDSVQFLDSSGKSSSIGVQDILSDSLFTTSEIIETAISSSAYSISTNIASNKLNRKFNICGHKLVELSQLITEVISESTFRVSNTDGFDIGSIVRLNNFNYTIIRSHDNVISLNQNISPLPIVGDIVYRIPCFNAYLGIKKLEYKTDYDIENSASNCNLVIYANAEENVTNPILTTFSMSFFIGSNIVISATNLTKVFSTRELIKPNSVTYSNYYEILTVGEFQLTLREVFADTSFTGNVLNKKVEYITDSTFISVDCIGHEDSIGKWIRYPSDVVSHILSNDASQEIDTSSFTESSLISQFKVSCYYPNSIGDESPLIRDSITKINNSVFGSLFYNSEYKFKYSVLNSNKPESINTLYDDDIISYDMITKNIVINRAKINYNPHTDMSTGEVVFDSITKDSEFVDRMIGYSKYEILETILFNESDANLILNRFLFFRSLTNSMVRIKSKLNLTEYNLNDPVRIKFDRLYTRYSGSDNSKIGILNYIERDESTCIIQLNDLGGVFNRVPAISPNSMNTILNSSLDQISSFGFIVDNLNETPDNNEIYLGSNLIG
jgi:hypothetical protein